MKRKIFLGLLGVVIVAVAISITAYMILAKPDPKIDEASVKTMYVKSEKVNITESVSSMLYRGRVTAYDNVSLSAEVSGKILLGDVRFKAGENFRKGQILVKIYNEDIIAALKSGKSGLLQTVSLILPDIMIDYPKQYDKWSGFFSNIDPEKPLPPLPEIVTEKERVFLASNNVLTNYYNLQQQEINLKRYTIKAPFNGFFKTVNKEIGAVASPGSELANIIRSDKLEIVVPVFPGDMKWIREGDEVKVTDNNGLQLTAKISRIAGFVEESTQSVNVYLTYIPKANQTLLEGEYVDVEFHGAEISGFIIPREAILEGSSVYEITDNKLIKTPVDIIRQLDDKVIINGIDTTKTIVIESLASVNPAVNYIPRP